MNSATKVVLVLALAAIVGLTGFIGGYATASFGPNTGGIPGITSTGAPDLLGSHVDEVNELLQSDALKPPSETSATAGAIQGLLNSNGDEYATYFDAKHFGYFNEDMAGEFGGIGVLLGERDGTAYVVEVYEGTPADTVGIKQGDIFLTIGGVTREQWTSEEVVKRVRGKEGTVVKLTMLRPGKDGKDGQPKKFSVTREMITFPNVRTSMKPGKVGYIRLGQFNEQATDEITKAILDLEKKGAKSFVLDLRDNPGGSLNQAITVSSLFIPSGVVVRVDERNKPETVFSTEGEKITDAPLVLLVNGNSASASEIVAGAMQDYNRATLVGEKTFGKGSVQTVAQLSFGGAVKFTTAHYLTPKKRVINKKGLVPDVVVKMEPEKQGDEKTDTQLQRAILEAKQLQ